MISRLLSLKIVVLEWDSLVKHRCTEQDLQQHASCPEISRFAESNAASVNSKTDCRLEVMILFAYTKQDDIKEILI